MKKIFLIIFLLAGFTSKAQYFQHLYGQDPAIGSLIGNGMNTKATGPGHLIGGLHIKDLLNPPPLGGPFNFYNFALHVIRTDADGRFTTPNDFNNTYRLTNAAGNAIRFSAGSVVEFSDGSGYGAIGTYFYEPLPRSFGIAYIRLDVNGNVISSQGYALPYRGGSYIDLRGMKESISNPGDLFATGTSANSNGEEYMWALKIDQNGTLLWGNLYDFGLGIIEDPADLIESPYASELIVVGGVKSSLKALWMVLDPNTGSVISADEMSSFYGTAEILNSIDVSNDPLMPGFILSGVVDEKVWVVKTDQMGTYQWGGVYQPSFSQVEYMYGFDAVGRLKEDGSDGYNYEYFITGAIYITSAQDPDAFIFKLDRWGNPVNPNALFIYNYGIEETGKDVDINISGSGDGVTMYGIGEDNNIPTKEIYVVKAYFNGVSGCNEQFEDLQQNVGELFPVNSLGVVLTPLNTEILTLYNIENELDKEICYNTTIPGGSNARIAPDEPKGDKEAKVSPNPIAQGAQYAALEVEIEQPTTAQVSVYDMLGRTYYSQTFTLVKGKNNLVLDISDINMAQGMYTVKVQGDNLNQNIMWLVK